MRQPAQARGTWRGRGGAGCRRANAAARARGPEIVPPEVLAGPPKRGAAPSNIGARANFCAGRAPDGPGKQSHSRQGAAPLLCARARPRGGSVPARAQGRRTRAGAKCGINSSVCRINIFLLLPPTQAPLIHQPDAAPASSCVRWRLQHPAQKFARAPMLLGAAPRFGGPATSTSGGTISGPRARAAAFARPRPSRRGRAMCRGPALVVA